MTDEAAHEAREVSRRRWRPRNLPWLLSSLDSPGQAVGYLGPNWFASIMGTGIVANAAASLPLVSAQLHVFAVAVWVFDAVLLVGLILAVGAHWLRHPSVARSHTHDASMSSSTALRRWR